MSQQSVYYRLVEEHFEPLERAWEERYQAGLSYWRFFVSEMLCKYLECCDLHFGLARVKCEACNHDYLLAVSCKCRYFCPSCHLKPNMVSKITVCPNNMLAEHSLLENIKSALLWPSLRLTTVSESCNNFKRCNKECPISYFSSFQFFTGVSMSPGFFQLQVCLPWKLRNTFRAFHALGFPLIYPLCSVLNDQGLAVTGIEPAGKML